MRSGPFVGDSWTRRRGGGGGLPREGKRNRRDARVFGVVGVVQRDVGDLAKAVRFT